MIDLTEVARSIQRVEHATSVCFWMVSISDRFTYHGRVIDEAIETVMTTCSSVGWPHRSCLEPKTVIALIAHDARKQELIEFIGRYVEFFRHQRLVATGQTGKRLADELGLTVERVVHGPEGGDLVIGGRVAEGHVKAVLFFRDPLTAQPHEPDVSALMRVCDVHRIPLATNLATAEAVVIQLKAQRP